MENFLKILQISLIYLQFLIDWNFILWLVVSFEKCFIFNCENNQIVIKSVTNIHNFFFLFMTLTDILSLLKELLEKDLLT